MQAENSMMRAVEITTPGEPEVLRPTLRPRPAAAAGEVLIRVQAAGVNRPDVAQRKGIYPLPPGASDIPGLEVAGVIAALGPGVTDWSVGDRVCALLTGGGYAEYVNAPTPQCLPVPTGLSIVEAAAIPETFFTVWGTVFVRGRLSPGESLLVHGGTSGIGTTAIQVAKALGSTVFATAGSDEKCAACERLGATISVNYRTRDFVEVLREATQRRGVDVILDMVGGAYLQRDIQLAATDGRIVVISLLGGSAAEIDLRPLLVKRLMLTGSTLRAQSVAAKGAIAQALLERVWPLIENRRVRPVIHQTFALEQAAEAHALMESGKHIGKIVLTL